MNKMFFSISFPTEHSHSSYHFSCNIKWLLALNSMYDHPCIVLQMALHPQMSQCGNLLMINFDET